MEYKIDLFAIFILLGLVQALFLSVFYLSPSARKVPANLFQGLFLIALSGVVLEILLMYTGYIVHVLHLVDFSESLGLLIGPMIFFIVYSLINNKAPGYSWVHYLLPLLWTLYCVFFYVQPEEVKYNAFLNAYHPEWPRLPVTYAFSDDPLHIRKFHSLVNFLSILFYTVLAGRLYYRYCVKEGLGFWERKNIAMRRGRNYVLISLIMSVLIILFKSIYDHDLGDHLLAAAVSVLIYYTSFELIGSSKLLSVGTSTERYSKSSLSTERKEYLVSKVEACFNNGDEHLKIGYSLSSLAKEVGVSPHHLSESINEGFGKSFFDLLAEYRVEAACHLLADEEGKKLKIEEVAERVGYSSKSSFNTQFKKLTGKTPSEYRSEC